MKKETLLQIKPEWAIEPNAISQGIFNLSSFAQKLMAMAMSLVSLDKADYSVSFKTDDFIRTMGLEPRKQGATTKENVISSVRECINSSIEIKMPNGDWKVFTWFLAGELNHIKDGENACWEDITMTFNPVLGDAIKKLKKGFSRINIVNLVQLQSKYAIRYYKLALSYSGFAGKDGNPSNQWYFESTILELRQLFCIEKKIYPRTANFRVRVIDEPLEELNAADIGLQIEPVYIRKGRYLKGVRFVCCWIIKRQSVKKITEKPVEELQEEALELKYPEEYAAYMSDYIRKNKKRHAEHPELTEKAAQGDALAKLREKYPAPALEVVKKRTRKKTVKSKIEA